MSEENQVSPDPVFATFVGEINQASLKPLMGSLCAVTQAKAPHLHLMLQSTGGAVADGIYLYNFLREFPLPITVYNGGQISSAGVTAYLGAAERVVNRYAAFMIHRCQASPQGANPGQMSAASGSLAIDDARFDAIHKAHLELSPERWTQYDNHFVYLSADDAIACGLASRIGDFAPPLGTRVYAFG